MGDTGEAMAVPPQDSLAYAEGYQDGAGTPAGFRERFRSLARLIREDLSGATMYQRATLLGTAVLLAIDVPAHEAILGMTMGHVYDTTRNPLVSGAAVGATAFAIEGAISCGVAVGVNYFPSAVAEYQRQRYADMPVRPQLSGMEERLFTLSFGSAAVIVTKHTQAEQPTVQQDRRNGLKAAAFLGVFNTGLAAGITGLAKVGEGVGWHDQADTAISVAKNPLTYLGLFGVTKGYKMIKARVGRSATELPTERTEQS